MPALDDLRVLDLSGQVAGPFCTKMFADFGADVVKIEPRGGEAGRRLAPLVEEALTPRPPLPIMGEGVPHATAAEQVSPLPALGEGSGVRAFVSAFFLYLNANKRSVTLDITTATGAEIFRRLVAEADIVVESFPPGTLDSLSLSFEALEALRPGIILTSITPFGQSGPWRDLPGNDLIAYACSGWASINGRPGRAPLKGSGYQASFQAGIAAFDATMAAVLAGGGQHIDVSILEPSVASFAPGLLAAQYRGEAPAQQEGDFSRGPVPTREGYFSLTLSRAHFWRDAMNELGLPQLAYDERFYEASYRQAHHRDVAPAVEARLAARGKRELFERLGSLRVVGGMVLTADELFEDPHVQARGFFVEQDHPQAGTLTYPGAPFKMSATPWALARPAPVLGEHTAEVLAAAGVTAHELARLRAAEVV